MSHLDSREQLSEGEAKLDLGRCLIFSASSARREMLAYAAARAGWKTVVCEDTEATLRATRERRIHLLWLDLADEESVPDSLTRCCRTLSRLADDTLVVICGREEAPGQELWARQLGVWIYLPGVSLSETEPVTKLCEQARLVIANIRS